MKILKHPDTIGGWKCPICKTSEDKEIVLCKIIGTKVGNNIEVEQIHVECIDLYYSKDASVLVARINDEQGELSDGISK